MLTYKNGSDFAIIILHEIYGINQFMEDICCKYSARGYDVYCPNLLLRDKPFDYNEQKEAYENFLKAVGFDIYQSINDLIKRLRPHYKKIILLGFSVGATIAWRCTDSGFCDEMIGCYGSRIRDYLSFTPKCPSLLLFARNERSFSVSCLEKVLRSKEDTTVKVLDGSHGFCDPYCGNYDSKSAKTANEFLQEFLARHRLTL